MSRSALRSHWLIFSILLLVLVAGVVAAQVSSSPTISKITLSRGESITLPVFRLFSDTVRISMYFDKASGTRRPELGKFINKRGSGYLEFESPGEPIVLQVRGPTISTEFEALPAGSYSANEIGREFVVRQTDGNPHHFPWPPDNSMRPSLPVGSSTVTITILEVGSALSDEQVSVQIDPPLTFKSGMPGYGFLWWFFFWPVFAIPIMGYAVVLTWKTFKFTTTQSRSGAS